MLLTLIKRGGACRIVFVFGVTCLHMIFFCQSSSELLAVSASGTQRRSGHLAKPMSGYSMLNPKAREQQRMKEQPFVYSGTRKVSA